MARSPGMRSRSTSTEKIAIQIGLVVTSATLLATEVYCREAIQLAKCRARNTPEAAASSNRPRGSARTSAPALIHINGSNANDTVDISGLTSAHRVVFDSNGGTDSVIGTVRPQDVITGIPGISASDLHVTTGTGVENDFQLMELVSQTTVAANDLVDHFALQSGHETVGVNAIAVSNLFLSSHDLLSGLDTTGPGNHQIAVDYALLQA